MGTTSCRLVQEVAAALIELDIEGTDRFASPQVSAGLCFSRNGDVGWKL